ncbi:MAG: DUF5056 domain-containing protein [Paludibacteraceae bacterium]
MENKEDILLREFLGKNKAEIQDGDFSGRVLRKLPDKKRDTGWIVPLFTVLGIAVSFLFIDIREVIYRIYEIIGQVPLIYLLGGIMLFPVIFLFFYFGGERNWIIKF